jgi:formamidopyrimidine-DNA glycosylase
MWWEMSESSPSSSSPLFHFGMTGALSIRGKGAMKYKAFVVDVDNWPPRFAKLVITFSNGITLAYTDPRRFGRVRLVVGDVRASPPVSELGFDPLLAMPDQAAFATHFTRRAAPIKVGGCTTS